MQIVLLIDALGDYLLQEPYVRRSPCKAQQDQTHYDHDGHSKHSNDFSKFEQNIG